MPRQFEQLPHSAYQNGNRIRFRLAATMPANVLYKQPAAFASAQCSEGCMTYLVSCP